MLIEIQFFKNSYYHLLAFYANFLAFFSRKKSVMICSDNSGWVLDQIKYELTELLGDSIIIEEYDPWRLSKYTTVLYLNRYQAVKRSRFSKFKFILAYYHGDINFNTANQMFLDQLDRFKSYLTCILVSNSKTLMMLNRYFGYKVRIHKIPITAPVEKFRVVPDSGRKNLRKKFKVPLNKVIIGSFQKDDNGWSEGAGVKFSKGPDLLCDVLELVSVQFDIFVILTGPGRWYVKERLNSASINYLHFEDVDYDFVRVLYSLLDLYVIPSRDEGGPRALLEGFASGVPVAATPVGQCPDIMAQIFPSGLAEDFEVASLGRVALRLLKEDLSYLDRVELRQSALKFSYEEQKQAWLELFL